MSRYLALILDHYNNKGDLFSEDKLRMDWQNYEAFDKLKADAIPFLKGVHLEYGDEVARVTDEFGDPLTYVSSYTLFRHLSMCRLTDWDAAVRVFVGSLPDIRIILWWH